jgi:hypothetical protein
MINSLLGDFEGGKLSPTAMDIASRANSLGFKIDKDLPNKEAATNIAAQMMGEYKAMLPGSMSDGDREFLRSLPPGIEHTAQGRQKIYKIQEATTARASQEHEMALKWMQKYGNLSPQFELNLNEWRRKTPMFQGVK